MEMPYTIARFYCFADFADYEQWQGRLKGVMAAGGVKGTILIAPEGVNGTVAGPQSGIDELMNALRARPGFEKIDPKFTPSEIIPFEKIKVRLKKEIITFKQNVDMSQTGQYVEPKDWNDLINDPNTVLVDTRNNYEFYHGHFKNAVDPDTFRFSELPAWVEANKEVLQGKKIAMYCTGGIRCEKSTAYMRGQGFDEVYHLRGGILGYIEQMPEAESLWLGECFVFDDREIV